MDFSKVMILWKTKTRNKLLTCPGIMTIILDQVKGLEFEIIFQYPLFININKFKISLKLK